MNVAPCPRSAKTGGWSCSVAIHDIGTPLGILVAARSRSAPLRGLSSAKRRSSASLRALSRSRGIWLTSTSMLNLPQRSRSKDLIWAVDVRLVESDAPTAEYHYAIDPSGMRQYPCEAP